jgi:hypothetical protein
LAFKSFDLFVFVLNLINSVVATTEPSKTGFFLEVCLVPNGTFGARHDGSGITRFSSRAYGNVWAHPRYFRWHRSVETMVTDQKPVDQMDALTKHAMEQAHEALDAYFDFLKKSVSSFPSGGTDLGEKLKDQSVQNITAMHELVKRLSQAKDFEEALRIQTAFMHSQLNVLGKQATSWEKHLQRQLPR